MEIRRTKLPDVLHLVPRRFADTRGHFTETWNAERFRDLGLSVDFVQDNQSHSTDAGTVRGLHYQSPPLAQAKLVRVVQGAILDVAVDIRRGSATYAKWVAVPLSSCAGNQLFVPAGFLHGFVTLVPDTVVVYKVDAHYAPECDGSVRFDDPTLAIDWGIDPEKAVLSEKDAAAPEFADFHSPFEMATGPARSCRQFSRSPAAAIG